MLCGGLMLRITAVATICSAAACLALKRVHAVSAPAATITSGMLFDFRTVSDLADWAESSDTVRTPGMSKAAFVLQKSQLFQRAVFFTMLNPQPNGAGFAGVANARQQWNMADSVGLELRVRPQGESDTYKVVLYHHGESSGNNTCAYEAFYTIPVREWSDVRLPFSGFQGYYRGRVCEDAPQLDPSAVSSVGLQIVGGVYSEKKQSGTSSLEIDYIKTY